MRRGSSLVVGVKLAAAVGRVRLAWTERTDLGHLSVAHEEHDVTELAPQGDVVEHALTVRGGEASRRIVSALRTSSWLVFVGLPSVRHGAGVLGRSDGIKLGMCLG